VNTYWQEIWYNFESLVLRSVGSFEKGSRHCGKSHNLVPRGPFCHELEISGPLARPNNIPVLNGCVNIID